MFNEKIAEFNRQGLSINEGEISKFFSHSSFTYLPSHLLEKNAKQLI
jgi:hypothetical protein